jgi:hypothetical protein
MLNGVNENPAPVADDTDNSANEHAGAEGGEESEASEVDPGEEKSSPSKPRKSAKGKKTMKTKGKKAAKAKGPAKRVGKKAAKRNGARPDSKMSQAVAFMQAERKKLEDPKSPPRGFRKELIERAAKKFGLAVATCSTQYGAKVHA